MLRSFVGLIAFFALFPIGILQSEEPGKSSPGEATTDDEKPQGKVKKLFDGKTLKGWKLNTKGFYEDHGKVSVKNGEIHLAKGDPATGIVIDGKPPKMNYEIRLEAKRMEGTDFFCGLTFPVGQTHQTLIVGGWGGGVIGLSNIDGMSAVENDTTDYTEFENDKWYKIRVRVEPKAIGVWIDKEQMIDLDPTGRRLDIWIEQDTSKPLGIGTWHTSAALRNIEIETLE